MRKDSMKGAETKLEPNWSNIWKHAYDEAMLRGLSHDRACFEANEEKKMWETEYGSSGVLPVWGWRQQQ